MRRVFAALVLASSLAACSGAKMQAQSAESQAKKAVKAAWNETESPRFGRFKLFEEGEGHQSACLELKGEPKDANDNGERLALLSRPKGGEWQFLDIVDRPFVWCEIMPRLENH